MRSTSSAFQIGHEAKPNSYASLTQIPNARAKRNVFRTITLRSRAEKCPKQNSAEPES
jgi:hypothetical protein